MPTTPSNTQNTARSRRLEAKAAAKVKGGRLRRREFRRFLSEQRREQRQLEEEAWPKVEEASQRRRRDEHAALQHSEHSKFLSYLLFSLPTLAIWVFSPLFPSIFFQFLIFPPFTPPFSCLLPPHSSLIYLFEL